MQIVRSNADPLLSVFQPARSGKLVSVTATSDILLPSIPHLYRIANYPVVLHISLQPSAFPDYSEITSIRQTGLVLLQSESTQEAQDMAIAAHALAVKTGKAVVHFFASGSDEAQIAEESSALLERALEGKAAAFRHGGISPTNLYADDGVVAHSNQTPPVANGANGQAEPSSNGAGASNEGSGAPDEEINSRPTTSDDIYKYASAVFEVIKQVTGRSYHVFEYSGPRNADIALFVFGSSTGIFRSTIERMPGEDYARVGVITSRLYRPWFGVRVSDVIPRTVNKIAVLEQIKRKTTRWGPLFLDLITCLRMGPNAKEAPAVVGHQLGFITRDTASQALRGVVQNLRSQSPVQNLFVGLMDVPERSLAGNQIQPPAVETAYLKILDQLFGKRLHIANSLDKPNAGIPSAISASPEYGYGSLLARMERRREFITKVERLAKSNEFTTRIPGEWLLKWLLVSGDGAKCAALTDGIIARLLVDGSPAAYELLADRDLFQNESHWLIGSDSWAYDLGNSGVHHVIASGENINMLVIDSQPYSNRAAADGSRRKKDIGLYAMNFGTAFVASVAVYSSYTQVLHAMIEADKFSGPSVVMAYLPYNREDDSPLSVLQETKKAVDIGYWPLYRWDPLGEEKGGSNFALDSEHLKNELKEFLKRDNQLSQLVKRHPEFSSNLSGSYGTEVRNQQKRKAKDAFSKLLDGLSGPPLTILFASDGGNAEGLSRRLGRRGKARGLKTLVLSMEDYPIEDLATEQNLVLVTSTAGQGEFPQNGRGFWETVKSSTDIDLATVSYSVFALGDSHYWPRKQDKHYYNKPGKDLDKRFADLGGKRLVDIGLGDDQDPDAYQTAYSDWEPKLWKALGVDDVGGLPDEPPPITNEDIKLASNFLRGTIAEGLKDETTGAISASDQQLTKFHGTYMQDDRDLREERKAQGMEPAYSFMIRCRLPGGVATPEQWIKMDDISTEFGNGTMKLTTRQTFQVCPLKWALNFGL